MVSNNRESRSALYAQYVSDHQGSTDSLGNATNLERLIIPHVPSNREISILDCGCGQGVLISILRRLGYKDVIGIDVSMEQVELARSTGVTGVFLEDIFDHAKSHSETYDVIIAIDVAEHFDKGQVLELFSAWFRLLKPGGRLIMRSPNGSSPFSGRYLYSDLTHGTIYTERSVQQACSSVGFVSAKVFPSRPAGRSVRQRARAALWRICEFAIIIPLAAETGVIRGHIVTQNLIGVADKGPQKSLPVSSINRFAFLR